VGFIWPRGGPLEPESREGFVSATQKFRNRPALLFDGTTDLLLGSCYQFAEMVKPNSPEEPY
jgi:hypothetical protein